MVKAMAWRFGRCKGCEKLMLTVGKALKKHQFWLGCKTNRCPHEQRSEKVCVSDLVTLEKLEAVKGQIRSFQLKEHQLK